jgi:hypothetical protein
VIIRPRAVPREVWWATAAMAVLGVASSNPGLTLAAAGLVPVAFLLLWRRGEPPALLFAVGFQWLQVFMPIANANFAGVPLADSPGGYELDTAAYLGLLALVVLAIGMRVGRGGRRLNPAEIALARDIPLNPIRLGLAYLLAHAVSYVAVTAGSVVGGLRQAFLVLDMLRATVVFIIIWVAVVRPRLRPMAAAVILVEIGMGFMGFFSGFKEVLFLAVIALLTAPPNSRRLINSTVASILVLTLLLSVFWQAVKVDYRAFLNQGNAAQVILVPPQQRIDYLVDRALTMDLEQLRAGLEAGAQRTGYLEYFGYAITMVPEQIPYQNGNLWGEAIRHVLMPRLFFPDKPAINDSDRVNKFTGQRVAGAEQGTSISLGYVAESYLDFGPVLMMVPILMLGIFFGLAYRVLATTGDKFLLSLAFAVSFILANAILFESSNIKIVGGALTSLMVGWGLLRFGSDWIWMVLKGAPKRRVTSQN